MDEKYTAALETARQLYNGSTSNPGRKEWLAKIFPELAESEDERIRKELIGMIDECTNWVHKKEYVKYLEKQKERQPVPALDRGDEIILKAICEELKDAPGWVERIEGWYSLAKDAQQPAEWNDEDEKMLHIVITDINYAQRHFSDSKLVPYGKKVDWLRAFRERSKSLEPQPKQEWSEEDEKMISALIRNQEILLDSASNEQLRDIYSKEIQWLESLRPQPHWKPSEEQIKAFDKVIREAERSYMISPAGWPNLYSLQKDLKKL